MWKWFHMLGSPPHLYRIAGACAPWFGWAAAVFIGAGLYGGLVLAPPDEEMGEGFRIIYVHVPSAWMSLFAYTYMAILAAIGLIWRLKLAHAVASACAVLGASFTFLALVTGAIWGKPMWGAWWVWDARLTSELLLLFLFLGYLALRQGFDDVRQADRASAVLAIVGVINVPIIHYSVEWWRTLHQPATVITNDGPRIASSMLVPLLLMVLGFTLFFAAVVCMRVRTEILRRERQKAWVRALVLGDDDEQTRPGAERNLGDAAPSNATVGAASGPSEAPGAG
ncbi:MAG: heme ABC transporter permease CcmC [Pseudomonadota bacterium]